MNKITYQRGSRFEDRGISHDKLSFASLVMGFAEVIKCPGILYVSRTHVGFFIKMPSIDLLPECK